VNREYDELRGGLEASSCLLRDGGKTAILTWKHTECAIVVDFSRRFEVKDKAHA
jgi:16S rRNA (cytosine1402-N4)-methyltransferase